MSSKHAQEKVELDMTLSQSERLKLLDLMWKAANPPACTLAPALAPAIAPAPAPAPPPALAWFGLPRSPQYSAGDAPAAARGSGVDEHWNDLQRLNHQRLNERWRDLQRLQELNNAEATTQAAAGAAFQLC